MTTNTKRLGPEIQQPREQQLHDIATSGDTDAAECAVADAFKEFPSKEAR